MLIWANMTLFDRNFIRYEDCCSERQHTQAQVRDTYTYQRPPGFIYREKKGTRSKPILHCEKQALQDLAERFGTPLYVYSASMVRERIRAFGALMQQGRDKSGLPRIQAATTADERRGRHEGITSHCCLARDRSPPPALFATD